MALLDFRAVFLPYCLQRQDDGRYAILNREYKPVGFFTTQFIDYSAYPVTVRLKGIGPATAAKLSTEGSRDPRQIFLYDDGTNPVRSEANMAAYLHKLRVLAKLRVV